MTFLKDGRRFIWESARNGWSNLYLYDLSGKLIAPLTAHSASRSASLVKVDEAAGVIFYTARDGDNYLKLQLHRVGLDGEGRAPDGSRLQSHHRRMHGSRRRRRGAADSAARRRCGISPDNKYFVDVYQTHDTPPATRLVDASGKVVAELAKSDLAKFNELGLKKAEMFTYKAADGKTTLARADSVPVELRSVAESIRRS